MTNKLKVSYQPILKNRGKPCWYITDGYENYMREDGTLHGYMTHDGGTYFATKEKAERVMRKWTDEPAAPKTWGEMTDAEKGALLLAQHEGEDIQRWSNIVKEWREKRKPEWNFSTAYRVRPPEPVRETERVFIFNVDGVQIGHGTVDTINGKPDSETIRMERINDQP